MGDCFPKCGGPPVSEACRLKTGFTEYAGNYKQWPEPVNSQTFAPGIQSGGQSFPGKSRYSFSKGARFGIPPYCDCTPPPERSRFETTYQHDFFDLHHDNCNRQKPAFPGVKPCNPTVLPKQYLCPFTTESTYSRAFDMPQTHFQPLCSQQEPCVKVCGMGENSCGDDCGCYNPCGINISFLPEPKRRNVPKLRKEDLIKPGTDTSCCPACPVQIPCCPCDDSSRLCDACCGCEYPCKLHQAATTPARKYPIVLNTPRYIPDPRDPPRRPLLLCSGGTRECPLQNQFPTQAAIAQAKARLLDKLEEERCKFPPECIESTYRSTYKTPPLTDVPTYCSRDMMAEARKAEEEVSMKGMPPKCIPSYCLDGGRPPDPRPMFDHMSTYGADYIWNQKSRFKLLGGEFPCKFEIRPLCAPRVIHASEVIKQRTEEKERWGENWECCPNPC